MPAAHYEFAVVGGGKGGKTLAAKMASAGRRVVMIEKGMIGGTCINVACIPTKALGGSGRAYDAAGNVIAAGWSARRVGMYGVSYNGTLPLAAAVTGPSALKTNHPDVRGLQLVRRVPRQRTGRRAVRISG